MLTSSCSASIESPLARRRDDPISGLCRPIRAAQSTGVRPIRADRRMSLKEDMPCELSILLPSIARPSVSTGCSRCSMALTPRPGLPALQHRAHRRERLSHHRRRRRLRRERAVDRGEGKHADRQGREAGQGRGQRRGALSGHRGARLRARLPACRLRPGQGRVPRERSPARRPRARDPRGEEAAPDRHQRQGKPQVVEAKVAA